MPIVSPFAGLVLSKVSPEAASTHSPPMKFLKDCADVVAMQARLAAACSPPVAAHSLLGRPVYVGERARVGAAAIADRSLLAVLEPLLAFRTAIPSLATVDDDSDVRVVLVVIDHLVVELVGELAWNDAIIIAPRL